MEYIYCLLPRSRRVLRMQELLTREDQEAERRASVGRKLGDMPDIRAIQNEKLAVAIKAISPPMQLVQSADGKASADATVRAALQQDKWQPLTYLQLTTSGEYNLIDSVLKHTRDFDAALRSLFGETTDDPLAGQNLALLVSHDS